MNNPDKATVVAKVGASTYAALFRAEWGQDIFSRTDAAYDAIVASIEAFERTPQFHPFESRYDDWLRGTGSIDAAERRGMDLFFDAEKGNCAACHAADRADPGPRAAGVGTTAGRPGAGRPGGVPARLDGPSIHRTRSGVDPAPCGAVNRDPAQRG